MVKGNVVKGNVVKGNIASKHSILLYLELFDEQQECVLCASATTVFKQYMVWSLYSMLLYMSEYCTSFTWTSWVTWGFPRCT